MSPKWAVGFKHHPGGLERDVKGCSRLVTGRSCQVDLVLETEVDFVCASRSVSSVIKCGYCLPLGVGV